jgi:hypothetical protein
VDEAGNHNEFGKAMVLDKERHWHQGLSKVGRKVLCMQSARNADFKSAVAGTDRLETVLENKAIN